MTAHQNGNNGVDDLLKRLFADDLPADVEAGMRERMIRFRAETRKAKGLSAAAAGFFRRDAWAVISILMLVAGILLQGLGSRSSLGERIYQIKTDISDSESNRRPAGTGVAANVTTSPEERPATVVTSKEVTS